jgi:hypothetical protein
MAVLRFCAAEKVVPIYISDKTYTRFEVFTPMEIQVVVLWDLTPFNDAVG